jgi:hypothetical protein
MRFSQLEDAIIMADGTWFYANNFIDKDKHDRLKRWMAGAKDLEIQHMVVAWLERDAAWIAEVKSSAVSKFWYIAPAINLESAVISGMLLKRAKQLRSQVPV